MKLTIEVDLGNDRMRRTRDVVTAIRDSFVKYAKNGGQHGALVADDEGRLRDVNGNTVGRWRVVDDAPSSGHGDDEEDGTHCRR